MKIYMKQTKIKPSIFNKPKSKILGFNDITSFRKFVKNKTKGKAMELYEMADIEKAHKCRLYCILDEAYAKYKHISAFGLSEQKKIKIKIYK